MNKKTYISALVLIPIFLVIQLVLKYIVPEYFVLALNNEHLVRLGELATNFIPTYIFINFLLGITTDYLFFGAACKRMKFDLKFWIITCCYNLGLACMYTFAPMVLATYSTAVMVVSNCYLVVITSLYTDNIKAFAVTYAITNISQVLIVTIRNASALLISFNILSTTLVSLESYLWLALCFVIFNKNFKKEGKFYGNG